MIVMDTLLWKITCSVGGVCGTVVVTLSYVGAVVSINGGSFFPCESMSKLAIVLWLK